MIDLLAAPENFPFSVALMVMLGIAVLEGVASTVGAGFSAFIDTLLPDSITGMELPEAPPATSMARLLSWLRIGRLPALMLLVIFLTAFALLGLALQALVHGLAGAFLPSAAAAVAAFAAALPATRLVGCTLERVLPKDETQAVSSASFIGRVAVVTLGEAWPGRPAQAKLRDRFGLSHYVMVEPDTADQHFESGTRVLLVRRDGSRFRAIRNPCAALED